VEENSTQNSVRWNKNRSKLCRSEPFRGGVILNCCFHDVQDKDLNPGYQNFDPDLTGPGFPPALFFATRNIFVRAEEKIREQMQEPYSIISTTFGSPKIKPYL
jgi:hypothetical protein